jgi:hypothetical protein
MRGARVSASCAEGRRGVCSHYSISFSIQYIYVNYIITNIYINKIKFCPRNRSRPVADWLRLKLVKTGLVTAKNRARPVFVGSTSGLCDFENLETSPGSGLSKNGQKTEPDRTSKHYPAAMDIISTQNIEIIPRQVPKQVAQS